jgi:hypothetical protein
MFEQYNNDAIGTFFSLDEGAVREGEQKLGFAFPEQLKIFYRQVGYGFLNSKIDGINRLMDPKSVVQFRSQTGQFEDNPLVNEYKPFEAKRLVFFEVNEVSFLSIGIDDMAGVIFNGDKKIADSLAEFLTKFTENETFYL